VSLPGSAYQDCWPLISPQVMQIQLSAVTTAKYNAYNFRALLLQWAVANGVAHSSLYNSLD
jgi:hypothetical protein